MIATKRQYFTDRLIKPHVAIKYKRYKDSVLKNWAKSCIVFVLMLAGTNVFSQQQDSLPQVTAQDTAPGNFVNQLRQLGSLEIKRSIKKFEEDRLETKQDELIEQIKETTLAAINHIEIGADTAGLNDEQAKIEMWYNIVIDGIFTNVGTIQTNRNLDVSRKILKELLTRSLTRKETLDKYYKDLVGFRNKIDSLHGDGTLYKFSADSATALRYIQKLILVANEIKPADSAVKQAILNVAALQKKINSTVNKLSSGADQIEIFQKELSKRTFKRETSNIGGPVGFSRPFNEIVKVSYAKQKLALYFFISHNTGKIVLLVLLIIAATFFLRSLKQRLVQKEIPEQDFMRRLVLRYPFLSAILLVFSLFQFIFPEPVFIFNVMIWSISGICLSFIFWNYISRYWMYSWLTLFFLFLLSCTDNMILQATRAERWIMLILAISGIAAGLIILIKGHKRELRERWILYFIALVAVMEFASAVLNIYGRYNLSKTLLTSGFVNVVIGILFLWTVRLINAGLSQAFDIHTVPDKKLFYINFKKLGNRVPPILYVALVIGWAILVGRNFYAFRSISDPINEFLYTERTLGSYTYTLQNMLVFFLILIIATITSKTVSFFASDNTDGTSAKKGGLGSWLLLVRISIISIGVLLAFAAAGIPTDRITIIISALGVGIGFGLQALVNNLVSGLIISFEKPVNVGDVVEIGTRTGVMKSIGFRSSVLYTWDGADVVIPNGDLLNQHLVNWTLANISRRIEILVGVAYGTDLKKVKEILKNLVTNDERILQSPTPDVLIKEFANSAINIQVFFWVRNVREGLAVKSDVISAIDIAFKENNIVIPFPQQDVHIHAASNNNDDAAKVPPDK